MYLVNNMVSIAIVFEKIYSSFLSLNLTEEFNSLVLDEYFLKY